MTCRAGVLGNIAPLHRVTPHVPTAEANPVPRSPVADEATSALDTITEKKIQVGAGWTGKQVPASPPKGGSRHLRTGLGSSWAIPLSAPHVFPCICHANQHSHNTQGLPRMLSNVPFPRCSSRPSPPLLLQSALLALRASRTTVIVAHRLSTIMDAHTVVVMALGQVAETGSHHELLAAGGLYAEMWAKQATKQWQQVGVSRSAVGGRFRGWH